LLLGVGKLRVCACECGEVVGKNLLIVSMTIYGGKRHVQVLLGEWSNRAGSEDQVCRKQLRIKAVSTEGAGLVVSRRRAIGGLSLLAVRQVLHEMVHPLKRRVRCCMCCCGSLRTIGLHNQRDLFGRWLYVPQAHDVKVFAYV